MSIYLNYDDIKLLYRIYFCVQITAFSIHGCIFVDYREHTMIQYKMIQYKISLKVSAVLAFLNY